MRLSLGEAAAAVGAELEAAAPALSVTTYHTDSRQVTPGGLFFALQGAETDGHAFVADAAARGASAVAVQRRLPIAIPQLVVRDTWRAPYDLAGTVLAQVSPLVVGVTARTGTTS